MNKKETILESAQNAHSLEHNPYNNPEYWCGKIGYRKPGYGDFDINTIKEIIILLARPDSVLDIGCAYGFSVGRLNMMGVPSMGVDISSYAISKAPEFCTKYIKHGAAWDLPFKDKSFDLAFSSGVLEHIPNMYLQRTVNEIERVCQRGIIGVACLDDATTKVSKGKRDFTHELILYQSEWQSMFHPQYMVVSDSNSAWRKFVTLEFYAHLREIGFLKCPK